MARTVFASGIIFVMAVCISFSGCKDQARYSRDQPGYIDSIEIAAYPDKTAYQMGELIDLTGLQVNIIYDDGSREQTEDYTVTGDTFTAGVFYITVSVNSDNCQTASFEITVSDELVNTGLPVIYIETENAIPITSKENYVNMNLIIVADNPDYCIEKTGFTDRIRGRGNTTWGYPKKPYRLNFRQDTSLFGLTASRNWVLLANYKDSTLITNTIAFELGRRFNFPFTNHYIHVEVVLNGNYQGSYVLTEHSRVGAGRVDIDPNNGYLVELDVYYDEDPKFRTPNLNLPVMILSPDLGTNIDNAGYAFVIQSLSAFDAALSDDGFPNNNYTDLIDIDSFVNFIMINEIVRNGELGHPKSTFLYRDAGAKISMGPLWDFDWAFGLGGDTSVNIITATDRHRGGRIFSRFFDDPQFVLKYRALWNEKLFFTLSISTFIDEMYNLLNVSQSLNSRRWYAVDYEYEIDKLRTWWINRIIYLNREINAE